MKIIFIFSTIVLLALILLFSWLPNPNIGSLPFFPRTIGQWINHYGNLRTAVPFFIVGCILEICFVEDVDQKKKRRQILAGLFLLVTFAEVGQLFLANRHFDLWDIFWGTAGAVVGLGLAVASKEVVMSFRA
jgi:glycopeptide antibiotics resistance protein